MEEQLFPRAELAPAYDQAVWLYVYRDFSEDERDRTDERVALRFGFSSYPQHKLIDPVTLEIVGDSGRSVESLLAAFGRAAIDVPKTTDAGSRLVAAEKRARKLEATPTVKAAEGALEDEDVVVRLRALAILAKEKPASIVHRAQGLLAVENDGVRYATCKALAAAGDTDIARDLDAVLATPGKTLNPNVLRMHVVQALARCGDAASIDALAPFADKSQARNALTKSVATTLVAIAERADAASRDRARDLLIGTLPDAAEDERSQRIVVGLAKHVHEALSKLTGRRVKFPSDYDERGVEALRSAWSR